MSDLVRGLPIRESNEGVKTECSTSNLKKRETNQTACWPVRKGNQDALVESKWGGGGEGCIYRLNSDRNRRIITMGFILLSSSLRFKSERDTHAGRQAVWTDREKRRGWETFTQNGIQAGTRECTEKKEQKTGTEEKKIQFPSTIAEKQNHV